MKKLRKVVDLVKDISGTFIKEDHNDHVDNWKEQLDLCKIWVETFPEIESLVEQLEDIVNQMRYVKNGDYYLSKDHNLFVQAWQIKLEIDKTIAGDLEQVSKLEEIVSQMETIKAGDIYFAMHHNLFADAWQIQEEINSYLSAIPPTMTNVYTEEWSYGGFEHMGKMWYEDWGYEEPPDMTQVYKEYWSG